MNEATDEMPARQALHALLSRYSIGPKHLVAPGPSEAELALMVEAALRAPDHGELMPFRFKRVAGNARARMAELFAAAARAAGKDEAGAALDAERALRPPVTVAVVARIDMGHRQVPAHEQWACVGGALSNFLMAAHLLGYGGKMLSGAKVRDPGITAAFCAPGETLLGWIALGTPTRQASGPSRKGGVAAALQDWTGT
ncbi:nitroreductase family protein [Roseateles koreensis]|uniref:Putative NAD(P)H nitroreductase n=1 Tax=Roseateles koreensis TaxID=2987526 RepID=A0ABT5KLJ7_9BURK|nr:nitroreductase [Roseateles koreensis]MDC8783729.1 nitroreductase [Roseateles koreensis]